ncbi:MAG TPA: aminotransferase class I/II-fold pyridoxal phosphate-dependent enzyme, partial [Caulobacteraceae bacterium]|nr:aminotransferase class I/II-fold pyridoxal phosphate-dependent enzyme [Caulobacteraceae bacterium]
TDPPHSGTDGVALLAKIEPAAAPEIETRIAVARPRLPAAAAIIPYLERIDQARWYSNFGPLIQGLEQRLAGRLGEGALVCTASNCTQALALALQAMDLPKGALVAAPAWTFVATAHAIIQAGLVPWFLDVDPDSWMLEPETVAAALARAPGPVAAVIPVCPFGAMPDLAAWRDFRDATGVKVLIDAAAAFDTLEAADPPACVSLHATKVLGVGEGAYLATTDPVLHERFRRLVCFGFLGSRESPFPAANAKLSEYAGAVGHAALDEWPLERLRYLRISQLMRIALAPHGQLRPQPGWGSDWVTSVCMVRTPDGAADRVESVLESFGVETRRWWGDGCHKSPAFADCPREGLPVTDLLAASTIGLPFAVDLPLDHIQRLAAGLAAVL